MGFESFIPLLVGAVLLLLGFWVAGALLVAAIVAIMLSTSAPAGTVMATALWSSVNSWELTALPLFVWLGEILFRSRLSEDLFSGLAPWLRRIPGRLLHINILGCALFAAVSGSSAATTATVGRMSLPELKERGYSRDLAIGTLAGSGTLGLLVPPSIILIVYGAATEQSIARLFMAGIIPSMVLAGLFMGYVAIWASFSKDMPEREPSTSVAEKIIAARRLLPVALLIVAVIGSIYAGIASPTEAAAVGVAGALVLWTFLDGFTWRVFIEGLSAAVRTSAMITLILACASVLTVAMGYTGLPRQLVTTIGELGLSPFALLAALTILFIVMGCFLDGISIVVLTVAVILPLVENAGFDLIWFGVYLVIVVEMSQITPPVGFNLFVIQSLTGNDIFRIAKNAAPFFLLLVVMAALLAWFPGLALWLPDAMTNN